MRILNSNFKTKNDALAKQPVYVAQIFFNRGNAGTAGANDIYFATCDVNNITGFAYPARWFPFLKADSIGSMSQTVDPINGVSSVGSLNVTITDYNGMVSDIIKAADAAGHGLRRQRITIFMLYKGMDWADKIVIRTMQVNDLALSSLNEYKLSAADVQRQLQKTIFNPYDTKLTAAIVSTGAITPAVLDARQFIATTSVAYGTSGFIKIDDEIMRWTAKTDTGFTVSAPDRGLFGSVSAVHSNGAKVGEVIVLNENPIIMALKIMESSGTASANGPWDVYPARWGCDMDSTNDIDEAGMLEVGKLLTGLSGTPAAAEGVQFEFVIAKGVEAKKFIEDSLWKILGCYGFVRGDGKYSIRAYSDLANAAKENASITLDRNAVVKWGDLTYNYNDLANQVWIEFDEAVKLSGKYIRQSLFIDSTSIKKWGEAKQLKYQAQGIIPTSAFASQLYQRFQRVLARYSRPPMQIPLTLLPRYHYTEIGDIVRVTLPVRDLFTGASLDRAFEVTSTQLMPKTGEVQVKCIAQPERAGFWFQGVGTVESITISPGVANIVTGATLQMVVRTFDASGVQVPTPAISWLATGNLSVSSTGLVTAGAAGSGTVYAVSGDKVSNIAAISITASANTNPVASVVVVPSSVRIKPGDTQQMTAIAYDIAGGMVDGKTFNWASSNPAAATVTAGSDTTKLLTAVANGTSNVTATETGSSIVSAATGVVVDVPVTPIFEPPALADSAYQIGTKITAHGPVGGPHVIPNGYNFVAGDYWYDGDVSLAFGTSCTINGTVRIFALGIVTINGTVDGAGRGPVGQSGVTSPVYVDPELGINGGVSGFVGRGGDGAAFKLAVQDIGVMPLSVATGALPIYQSAPVINVIPSSLAGSSWATVTGLPTLLTGGQAASGGVSGTPGQYSGASGAAGAGLMIMARGIYVTTGLINLSGIAGGNCIQLTQWSNFLGGGGGGGGGSFVALAERNIDGLPVMSLLPARVNTTGGAGGTTWNGMLSVFPTAGSTIPAMAGGYGALITQIIG